MKLHFVLLISLCLVFSPSASPQKAQALSSHADNVFLELGGNAGLISLNYDRRFAAGSSGFGARVGVGTTSGYYGGGHGWPSFVLTLPIAVNYLLGQGPHHLEAGAGVTIGSEEFGNQKSKTRFVPSLGYRYQNLQSGFTFRLVASPMIASKVGFSAGLSFGFRF